MGGPSKENPFWKDCQDYLPSRESLLGYVIPEPIEEEECLSEDELKIETERKLKDDHERTI
jgi:hypothetical protein